MDRRTRIHVLAVAVAVFAAVLAVQAVTAEPPPRTTGPDGAAYPGNTLITVQSYGWFDENNGKAFIVTPEGEVVWEFDPPNSRVFDAEMLGNGNVLVSVATAVPAEECPTRYRDTDQHPDHCAKNRVVELASDTAEVVWSYEWYDAFVPHHEVHDADRLPSGETAIVDMGNDRAFTVDRDGEVTWEWHAEDHIGPGTDFWDRYVPEGRQGDYRRDGPHDDWTHMNDIDRLENGHFQLSIRNFDVIVEVDPRTDAIVDVIGRPGEHAVMNEQHNPHRIEHTDTLVIGDSENNRIVEVTTDGEVVWEYAGGTDRLQWPRDADRLPNGNTLIADSRNFRVLEINATGEVVWEYSVADGKGIVYEADRLGPSEEPAESPGETDGTTRSVGGPLTEELSTVESWAGFVFPSWVSIPELVTMAVGLLVAAWLALELVLLAHGRRVA